MSLSKEAISILVNLGFTQLESEIYTYLIVEGASTGYGVAKGVGKPTANVYKAIESLSQKGAIEKTIGTKQKCIAVPWQQLVDSQKKQFNKEMEILESSFRNLPATNTDEQVYQLENIVQIKDFSQRLIKASNHSILADIEPSAVEFLSGELEKAAERGVEVIVKVYEPVDLKGVKTIIRDKGKEVYQKTKDTQLSICSDGSEILIALLSDDAEEVIQAFKTKSSLLSLTVYNKLLYEFTLTQLKQVIPLGDIQAAQDILNETSHLHPFSAENHVMKNFEIKYQSLREE